MLRCVRKEGKVFFAFDSNKYKFRPHQSTSYIDGKVKICYKVWTNLQKPNLITIFFTKVNTRVFLEFFHS
jgi:hypothetical protein